MFDSDPKYERPVHPHSGDEAVAEAIEFLRAQDSTLDVARYLINELGVRALPAAIQLLRREPDPGSLADCDPMMYLKRIESSQFHQAERVLYAANLNGLIRDGALTPVSVLSNLLNALRSGERDKAYTAGIALSGINNPELIDIYKSKILGVRETHTHQAFSDAMLGFYALRDIRDPHTGKLSAAVEATFRGLSKDERLPSLMLDHLRGTLAGLDAQDTLAEYYAAVMVSEVELNPAFLELERERLPAKNMPELVREIARELIGCFGLNGAFAAGMLVRMSGIERAIGGDQLLVLADDEVSWRTRYLLALELDPQSNLQQLAFLLESGDNRTKSLAAVALWSGRTHEVKQVLFGLLRSNSSSNEAKAVACYVLGGLQDEDCELYLVDLMRAGSPRASMLRAIYNRGMGCISPEELFVRVFNTGELFDIDK